MNDCTCECHAWDGVPHRRRCSSCGHLGPEAADELRPGIDYEPAVCANCGKDEHTPDELAACIDSVLAPRPDFDDEYTTVTYHDDGSESTACCAAYTTYHDDILCCRACYRSVTATKGTQR